MAISVPIQPGMVTRDPAGPPAFSTDGAAGFAEAFAALVADLLPKAGGTAEPVPVGPKRPELPAPLPDLPTDDLLKQAQAFAESADAAGVPLPGLPAEAPPGKPSDGKPHVKAGNRSNPESPPSVQSPINSGVPDIVPAAPGLVTQVPGAGMTIPTSAPLAIQPAPAQVPAAEMADSASARPAIRPRSLQLPAAEIAVPAGVSMAAQVPAKNGVLDLNGPLPGAPAPATETGEPFPAMKRGKPGSAQTSTEMHRPGSASPRGETAPSDGTKPAALSDGVPAPDVNLEKVQFKVDTLSDTLILATRSDVSHAVPSEPTPVQGARQNPDQAATVNDRASPADQVSPALVGILKSADGTQSVTVRLQPAELGQVQIRVERTNEGTAHVGITADRPETLQLLQRDLPRLEQALDQAGIQSNGRSVSFQATPPDQVGASASRPDTMSPGSGGFGQGQSGGAWRGSEDSRRDTGNDPGPDQGQGRTRWLRAGLDITA